MRYDACFIGLYILDVLGRPVSRIPDRGNVEFIDEIRLTVAGTAGGTVIDAAKLGLKSLAVGAVGEDEKADFVLMTLGKFGVDTSAMQRIAGVPTSATILNVRPNGDRPALHVRGASDHFELTEADYDLVLDAPIIHLGGTGLAEPARRGAEREASRRGETARAHDDARPSGGQCFDGASRAAALAACRLLHAVDRGGAGHFGTQRSGGMRRLLPWPGRGMLRLHARRRRRLLRPPRRHAPEVARLQTSTWWTRPVAAMPSTPASSRRCTTGWTSTRPCALPRQVRRWSPPGSAPTPASARSSTRWRRCGPCP